MNSVNRDQYKETDERFDEEFVERHIWEETPLLYDTDFKEIKRLKDFLHSELEKVRQETIKECIKELRLDWKPTEGFGCEEEKGFQKGIIAEQLQVKSKLQNLLSIKH